MAAGDFAGANVTVPHKEAALALADTPSGAAREIGAANTLVFHDGRVEARNTDAGGLLAALPGPPRGQRALVLGAGGAARAAVWALAGQGATVEVWNRTACPGRGDLRRAGGVASRRSRPGRLRADRQHQRRRSRRRGPLRAPAAARRSVRRRPDGPRHGLRRRAERAPGRRRGGRRDRRRRPRGPGPAGRPLAPDLDRTRAAGRDDARRCPGGQQLIFTTP